MDPRFAHIRHWVFDLDNCLYPAATGLFALIDERMGAYIARLLDVDAAEARRVQKEHFHAHGTTLAGLMREQDVDPHHFLNNVHDIPLNRVARDERLARGLELLPGQKLIFPNGDAPYAGRVLGALGIADQFDAVHDIHAAELRPKPDAHGYRLLLEKFAIDPAKALMVEDMAQNLQPAKALGMTTIWVDNGSERGNHGHDPDFIDLTIADVGEWLDQITKDTA